MTSRKPKRVEIGLRLDDMVTLRHAGRAWREVMVKSLRDMKSEMERRIKAIEILDDALGRLDTSIAKAEAAWDSATTRQQQPEATDARAEGDDQS